MKFSELCAVAAVLTTAVAGIVLFFVLFVCTVGAAITNPAWGIPLLIVFVFLFFVGVLKLDNL